MANNVTIGQATGSLAQLSERSREIFRRIVESYLLTGEPLGSRNLSRILPMALSPASVRNVMADLEDLGLVYAPHTSAGRLPTERGLRFFVDALMQFGDLSNDERQAIEGKVIASGQGRSMDTVLAEASQLLSGLTRGAAVVLAGKHDLRLKHIEFVRLDPEKALVILVAEDGSVENRILTVPAGLPASALVEAANFLNTHIRGRTLIEARDALNTRLGETRSELDDLTRRLVEAGLADWSGGAGDNRQLIVRGQANLLEDLDTLADLERIRLLFDDLEQQRSLVELLENADVAQGVRIFIGSENKLFSLSGSSLVAAPYRDASNKVVGVLGIIGPTRLNYARIVPMVDYTAQVVSRVLGG